MVGVALKNLSLSYLSDQIGISGFNLARNSFDLIAMDGHFEKRLNDKELAAVLFENSIPNSFFQNLNNFKTFFNSLATHIKSQALTDLGKDIKTIRWDQATSEYFITKLGLSPRFKLEQESQKRNETESVFEFSQPDIIFKKLKQYQSDVFFKTYQYVYETPFSRCIIQMPTGSGKTRTAMEIVCEFINDTSNSVIWLANTEELCDQAFESFCEVWRFLAKKPATAINHVRGSYDFKSVIQTFHVTTLQSFNSSKKETLINKLIHSGNSLGLVIVDEAHISIAPTYKETIEKLISNGAKLIGLTATPGRQLRLEDNETSAKINVDQNQILSKFYFDKKFEINTGNIPPIEYLRNEGILSNVKFTSLEGSFIEHSLTIRELSNLKKTNNIPKKIQDLLTNNYRRNAIIFDQINRLSNEGKKILFFGTSLEHSKLMATLLRVKGHTTAHIDGETGSNRKNIIREFKEGKVQILCNYGVLSTGFDDPEIDVVFMARPTNSIVLYSQIIGRGLRGPKIGGTDYCEIYTVVDNIVDLPDNSEIYSYFDDYFIN